MKKMIYAIYDKKLEQYMNPMTADHDAIINRDITAAMLKYDTALYQFADDHALYQVGWYDAKYGEPESVIPPRLVCEIRELKNWIDSQQTGEKQ